MTYTLAIVDDGLLDLTNFKTPDPWNEFYAREALGIRTWDMYDDVLGASGGRYSSLFSTGGDACAETGRCQSQPFQTGGQIHLGPFYLAKGKQQTHTLKTSDVCRFSTCDGGCRDRTALTEMRKRLHLCGHRSCCCLLCPVY